MKTWPAYSIVNYISLLSWRYPRKTKTLICFKAEGILYCLFFPEISMRIEAYLSGLEHSGSGTLAASCGLSLEGDSLAGDSLAGDSLAAYLKADCVTHEKATIHVSIKNGQCKEIRQFGGCFCLKIGHCDKRSIIGIKDRHF